MATQVYLIVYRQYGTDGIRKAVTPFIGRTAAATEIARLHDKARADNAMYVNYAHYTPWGRHKTEFDPLTLDSFHVQHLNGTESSVELMAVDEGSETVIA